MTNFKLTVSDIKGKSVTKELKDNDANPLLGLEIGNETDAAIVGLKGKIKVTGGSDKSGVPMRNDIHGAARKFVFYGGKSLLFLFCYKTASTNKKGGVGDS